MKEPSYTSSDPFKVMKMVNGEDIICKISEEYTDAVIVEHPMSVVKQQIVEHEQQHIVEHTGLQRWMNFTRDHHFVISKEKILSFGDLAPEVKIYYKHILKRLQFEESHEPTDEDEAMSQMKDNLDKLMGLIGNPSEDGPDIPNEMSPNVFPIDKSKLH